MEERKRRKGESELPDIPTGSDEELRSSRDKQGQDETRDVISIGENASRISHRATSLYDKWSETGSTFLEKDKYKVSTGVPGYQTSQQAPVTHGLPLVQVQLPEKLRQLTGDKIENFLRDYRNTVRNVPSLSIQSLLTKDVSDSLEQRGVNIASSEAILSYLTRHLINFEKAKRLRCLGILEKNLKWPSANLIPAEQIYLFFDQVSKILKHLDKEELRTHKKKILRGVINQIPSAFGIEYQQFILVSKGYSLSKLKSLLLARRFVLERRNSKWDERNAVDIKKQKQRVRRVEDGDPIKQSTISGSTSLVSIRVKRVGDKARSISLLLKNVESGDFVQVKGLADTGADLNVAGLSSMQAYKIREEKPQFIKNVTFMDKKPIPVKAVVIAHVLLVQDGWKLDLKEQRFFCVDSELWDEMIIGDRTLRYFGVKLNIKDAPKAVRMKK
eukprot:snap_masked-scaffold_23-processed-gene-2.10-mRNA-1 protein AED:1.00 eAED:1.00 QI:0/-1/0/0/-1/1/1/0/443